MAGLTGIENRAVVIGLGDILNGDMGTACSVIEMLAQESQEEALALHYLAGDAHYVGDFIFGHTLAVVVMAVAFGGQPGKIYRWDLQAFRQNIGHFIGDNDLLHRLVWSLWRTELSGHLPMGMLFLWIEPGKTDGVGLSSSGRRAARKAVQLIKGWLSEEGVLLADAANVRAFHNFDYFSPISNRIGCRVGPRPPRSPLLKIIEHKCRLVPQ
jgi:hydrogenase maturation protease